MTRRAFRRALRLGPAQAAAVATLIGAPLVGGLVYGAWSALTHWQQPSWHAGPTAADLERDLALHTPRAAPAAALGTAIEAEVQPATISRSLRVTDGDTLMGLLTDAGIDRQEAYHVIEALREVFSPKKLRPGHEIRLSLAALDGAPAGRLLSLSVQPDVEHDVRVTRAAGSGFIAEAVARPLLRRTAGASGTIETSLAVATQSAGVPAAVMLEMIRIFSFDVDFQRELQVGDRFEVVYDALVEPNGTLAKTADVRYAALTLSGKRLELYAFTPKSGVSDFFDPSGQSVRRTLMRTPIDGARLSSGFGMRRHPILGYSRMHRGSDFAAPTGTPIYAAGDGVVEVAGRNGAYGNYVRIRHNGTYKTAYAHMSRIAKSARKGARVRQGQVIGYVGSTGRSTGPHLHYEVLVDNKQVNPLQIKLPSGEKLAGADLDAFKVRRAEVDRLREALRGETLMVDATCFEVAATPVPEPSVAAC